MDWTRGVAAPLLIGSRCVSVRLEAVKEEKGEEIIAWDIQT